MSYKSVMKNVEFNYTESQLNKLDANSPTISAQFYDYEGEHTKYLGFNSLESIKALREFLDKREKAILNKEITL